MIAKGSKIRIQGTELTGSVVETKEGFAHVSIGDKLEWKPFAELEEISDELLNRMLKGDLDNSLDFILAIDANRLLVEQLWNPYVFASSSRIEIYPHQIDEVTWALENPKTLIADEVGLGKTIIAALVSTELKERGLSKRALYVVPKSLVLKWQGELNEKFGSEATVVNSNYANANPTLWKEDEFSYIASMDYLKQDHIMERLRDGKDFDVVVVDEAHKFKIRTARYQLGSLLSAKANIMMFLTATPHDGRNEDFSARMQLLDPFVGDDIRSANYLWTRNIKEDVRDINGKEVFPPRESKTVEIPITNAEQRIHDALDRYLSELDAQVITPQERGAVRFLRSIFRKRGSSSIHALLTSLKRRLEKLGTIDVNEAIKGQTIDEPDDDIDEEEEERSREQMEAWTPTRDLAKEKADLRDLISEIEQLDKKDSKLEELEKWIKKIKEKANLGKVLLFTEYRDTLDYLQSSLEEKYKVGKIDGTMDIYERKEALDEFRKEDGPQVFLCTDAAGEGIDMQWCNVEINYDLPWNPNKLEQRMGRIHRIGQKRNVYYYNFTMDPEKTIDGYILGRLLDKIENIKLAMEDKVYDIIGSLVKQEDIAKMYEALSKIPKEQWEPKIDEFLENIDERKKDVQDKAETLLTGNRFDKSSLENFHKVRKTAIDKGEVKRFVQTFVETNDGNMTEIKRSEDRFMIYPPREVAHSENLGSFEGTFDRDISLEKGWDYLALGTKEINAILKYAVKKWPQSCSTLKHLTKSGIFCIYKLTIEDGNGRNQMQKIVGLYHNEDAKISEVDVRSLWDYEEAEPGNTNTNTLVSAKERTDQYVNTVLSDLEKKTKERLDKVKKSNKDIVRRYYSNKASEKQQKIDDNSKKQREGPHITKIITRLRTEREKLTVELDNKIAEIEKSFVLHGSVELIGMASIIPDLDSNIRREIELAGMKAVMEYENNRAKTDEEKSKIKDVSERDTGFDIESFNSRCIEVKSFRTTDSPSITSHEWETARKMQDDYWLYIVENALDNPKVNPIQDPYEKFKDSIRTEEETVKRYYIDNWKEVL